MSEAVVVGAGLVGLSTAWHLQEKGYDVTVIDRVGVAGGSSWGNAGWLAPGKTIPLSNAGLWSLGPRELFSANSALHVPMRLDPKLWNFLAHFMAHANQRAWDRTMARLTPIDLVALDAFDELIDGGVDNWTAEKDFIVGFEKESDAAGFISEVEGAVRHGQDVPLTKLDDPRSVAPQLSDQVGAAYRLGGQRFIEPGHFTQAVADAVIERGGTVRTGVEVTEVTSAGKPVVVLGTGERIVTDKVVLANGAWLPELARDLGVKTLVQAGRGYSFSVATEEPAEYCIYLPEQRLAMTPYEGRLRIAGTMEFRNPDEPFDPKRVDSMIAQSEKLMTGIDLDNREDEWVGSRPVTPDGLPLIGETKLRDVFVAGGHGMWGIILAPASGKYLAELIDTGVTNEIIKPFDPLR